MKRSKIKFATMCILALLVIAPLNVAASTYYVNNSGDPACVNGSGAGSAGQPWCTIGYAVGRIGGGDHLIVESGTYNETFTISNLDGTAQNHTTIKSKPGGSVIIKGGGVNGGRIKIDNCSYLILEGLEITNMNQGLHIQGGSSSIIVRNNSVHYVGQEAIHIKENSSYISIINNRIYDTRKWQYNGEGVYVGTGSAGPVDNTNNVEVIGNTIYNIIDEAIEFKGGTYNCVADGNIIYNVETSSSIGAIEINPTTVGVQTWGANPNHIVKNNVIHDTDTGIVASTGSLVFNNVIYDIKDGNYGIYVSNQNNDNYMRRIYHNTIDEDTATSFRNNGGETDVRYNIGPSGALNIPASDAFFASVAEGSEDYHIVAGSDPIDAVSSPVSYVTDDIEGVDRSSHSSPDYGAYEFSTVGSPPPDPPAIPAPKNLRVVPRN